MMPLSVHAVRDVLGERQPRFETLPSRDEPTFMLSIGTRKLSIFASNTTPSG